MPSNASNVLGVMLNERGLVLAHVVAAKPEPIVKRLGRFAFEEGISLDQPEAAGKALRLFLDGHGFAASKAVVGVPARWLIAQEKELPPIDAAGADNSLRLSAERMSLAESGSLIADYAGKADSKNPSKVLLVGMLRGRYDKIIKMLDAADLSAAAVCPTSLATARLMDGDRSLLRLTEDGAELVLQQGGTPRLIQPMSPDPAQWMAEVKRTLTLRGASKTELLVCDGVGLSSTQFSDLSSRLSAPTRDLASEKGIGTTIDPAARNGAATGMTAGSDLAAIALALAGIDRKRLALDFSNSRLREVKRSRFGRRTILAAAAVALLVILGIAFVLQVNGAQALEASLSEQLKKQDPDAKAAQALIDRVNYGRTFFETRPPYLEVMKQITSCFHYQEPIWVSSITFKNGTCTIQGRSVDPRQDTRLILAIQDRLKAIPGISDMRSISITDVTGKEQIRSFTISFNVASMAVAGTK